MKADLSRNTFQPDRHYRDVVKQQGRVELDADWNEQQAINVHRVETETVDVVGRTGAPVHQAGFAISTDGVTLRIGVGRLYVDGILCENTSDRLDYATQPDRLDVPPVLDEFIAAGADSGIVYLDVWLRHVTALNDARIREVALGGPDTATRTQVVWQVRILPLPTGKPDAPKLLAAQKKQLDLQTRLTAAVAAGGNLAPLVQSLADANRELAILQNASTAPALSCTSAVPLWDRLTAASGARLTARTAPTPPVTDLCQLPPRAGYQRTENQLYRIEVHHGGDLGTATFKWSRDNGTVATAVEDVLGNDVRVRSVGPDEVLGFATGQWVELVDDAGELDGVAGRLIQIDAVPAGSRDLTMKTTPPAVNAARHPILRRWDQSGAAAGADGVPITGGWQALEDGVEIRFAAGPFRSGDYWLVPARTATGEVEWPPYEIPNLNPRPQPPCGIGHHYCRLALVQRVERTLQVTADCRPLFAPLTEIAAPAAVAAMHVKGTSWQNDGALALAEFLERGLRLDFDRTPDPASISTKTMIVTFELPMIQETGFEAAGTSRETVPRLSVILFGEITVKENQVRWLPVRSGLQALTTYFRGLTQLVGRVTLKGGAIWTKDAGERVHLDGRALGLPAEAAPGAVASRTDLALPSGGGVRASDFESWFLLTLPTALAKFGLSPSSVRLQQQANSFVFVAADTGAQVTVVGVVTLASAATAEVTIALSAPENRELIDLPASVTVPAGSLTARFVIGPGPRFPDGTVQVKIVADASGEELSAVLTIARG